MYSAAAVRDEYAALIEDIKPNKEEYCIFRITYVSRLRFSSILMTEGFPAAFAAALIAVILIHAEVSVLFIILAAYVAYVCVYMSYLRDGFRLPRREVFFCLYGVDGCRGLCVLLYAIVRCPLFRTPGCCLTSGMRALFVSFGAFAGFYCGCV